MPIVLSFAGQLQQSKWWQPARDGLMAIADMEPGHRNHTYQMLLRQQHHIKDRYGAMLRTEHEAFAGSNKLAGDSPKLHHTALTHLSADGWLRAMPLMKALKGFDIVSDAPAFTEAKLCFSTTFALPDTEAVNAAKNPMVVLENELFRLRLAATEAGSLSWGFSKDALGDFPRDSVATAFQDALATDALDAYLRAVEVETQLREKLKAHVKLLQAWPASGYFLRPKDRRKRWDQAEALEVNVECKLTAAATSA